AAGFPQLARQAQTDLDRPMLEDRHAPLEAEGHRDAVRLHEEVVRQPGAEVGVLRARDVAPDVRRRAPGRDERLAARRRGRLPLGPHPALPPAPAPLTPPADAPPAPRHTR